MERKNKIPETISENINKRIEADRLFLSNVVKHASEKINSILSKGDGLPNYIDLGHIPIYRDMFGGDDFKIASDYCMMMKNHINNQFLSHGHTFNIQHKLGYHYKENYGYVCEYKINFLDLKKESTMNEINKTKKALDNERNIIKTKILSQVITKEENHNRNVTIDETSRNIKNLADDCQNRWFWSCKKM